MGRLSNLAARRADEDAGWKELEGLLDRLESDGEQALNVNAFDRLGALYRRAGARLADARSRDVDLSRKRYLDGLVRRAHYAIYQPERRGLAPLFSLFRGGFAASFRRTFRLQILSFVLMLVPALLAYEGTKRNPQLAYPLMGLMVQPEMVQELIESDAARSDYIQTGRGTSMIARSGFAMWLVANNTRVAWTAFATGIAFAIPTTLIQAANGALLGAMSGLYDQGGVDPSWWAWVLPHGIPELLALCVAAAAGLGIGISLIDPRGRPRREALLRAGREGAILIGFATVLLLYAGLIEGLFRQMTVTNGPRYALAVINFVLLGGYLLWAGRSGAPISPREA